jgi:hypothetical protein
MPFSPYSSDPNTAVNDLAGLNPVTETFYVLDKDGTTYYFTGGVGLSNGNTSPTDLHPESVHLQYDLVKGEAPLDGVVSEVVSE